MTPIEYRMSGVGSSVLSRWATAKTRRSPLSAASIARRVPGRPAAMGAVSPGKMTVPRSGRTGRVWRVAIVIPGEMSGTGWGRRREVTSHTPFQHRAATLLRGAPELIRDWRRWRQTGEPLLYPADRPCWQGLQVHLR